MTRETEPELKRLNWLHVRCKSESTGRSGLKHQASQRAPGKIPSVPTLLHNNTSPFAQFFLGAVTYITDITLELFFGPVIRTGDLNVISVIV